MGCLIWNSFYCPRCLASVVPSKSDRDSSTGSVWDQLDLKKNENWQLSHHCLLYSSLNHQIKCKMWNCMFKWRSIRDIWQLYSYCQSHLLWLRPESRANERKREIEGGSHLCRTGTWAISFWFIHYLFFAYGNKYWRHKLSAVLQHCWQPWQTKVNSGSLDKKVLAKQHADRFFDMVNNHSVQ